MAIEIKIPELGESITEVQIASWLVKEGDPITKDQNLVSIESEKATVEIAAPESGAMGRILKPDGSPANVGDVIGHIEASPEKSAAAKTEKYPAAQEQTPPASTEQKASKKISQQKGSSKPKPEPKPDQPDNEQEKREVTPAPIEPDKEQPAEQTAQPPPESGTSRPNELSSSEEPEPPAHGPKPGRTEQDSSRVDDTQPLSPLRRTVAKRLVEARQTMAILTTFNEIDMSAVIALRKHHQEAFQAKAGVKLGFMSFFVKAAIDALKAVPQLNAEIRGNDIVYHRYFDIGVAVGAGKGLVVPPLRNAEKLSFAGIEKAIADLASRAKDNKLKPQELEGGTFTISNGGVYGSLLSTPIINPPQSGILGLHSIQERPVVREGQIVIRSMMYVALSYDHRIVDGREAVQFLVRIKELVEDPARMLLEI